MNCRNCSAPMELFERRAYFFCRYCSTFEFLARDGVDGVQVVEPGAGTRPCPVCAAPLAAALLDGAHRVHACEQCRGMLVPRARFADVIFRRRAAGGAVAVPIPPDRSELERRLTCPACRFPMEVHPYYGPGNVIIDTCSRCDVIWLDPGELTQISEAPGKDRIP